MKRQSPLPAGRTGACLFVVLVTTSGVCTSFGAEVGFNSDVGLILSEHCFACHGPDAKQRKGKLRLDVREEALKPAASGKPAIVPGQSKQRASAQQRVLERWIADGALFLTIWPMRHKGGIQRTKDRENEWLTDLADTTGAAMLGLTTGCARCHDHKFDPLTQADYYGLQAIFADSQLKEERPKGANNTSPAFISVVQREQPGVVQLLRRGEVDLPVREVAAALRAVLPGGGPLPAEKLRRAALAQWLTSPRNPLTARVLANRVWQWHFGQGLVRTANDFGHQGEAPSHPELLDWLASELLATGWDLRHLHRLILDSATYRQTSVRSDAARRVAHGPAAGNRGPARARSRVGRVVPPPPLLPRFPD